MRVTTKHNNMYEPDVLFVCYDAGESLAFEAIFQSLENLNINVLFLLIATAEILLKTKYKENSVSMQRDLSVNGFDPKGDRWQTLDHCELEKISNMIAPKIIVSGMASMIQTQIITLYKERQQHVIKVGFYDSFKWSPDNIMNTMMNNVNECWVVAEGIRHAIIQQQQQEHQAMTLPDIHITGNPSVDTWVNTISHINPIDVRRQLGITASKPVLMFAGQYGPGYEDSLISFCNSVRDLKLSTKYTLLLTIHPKVNGDIERSILELTKVNTEIQIVPKSVSTMHVASIADIVVAQESTVAIQCLFVSKQSIFYQAGSGIQSVDTRNVIIDANISPLISDEKQLESALRNFETNKFHFDINKLKLAHIPFSSSQLMINKVLKLLSRL